MISYMIEAADRHEPFVINGEIFKSETLCLGLEEGQRATFLDGSLNGRVRGCATLYNLGQREMCHVWCE